MTVSTHVAIIGAGPYGLSVAAHLRQRGVDFRIFGTPLLSWRAQMPKGMFLKSEGFASNLFDPEGAHTLKRFCADRGWSYDDHTQPVPLDTFAAYGLSFQQQLVPNVEERNVVSVRCTSEGFALRLDNGDSFTARRVVVAA